MRSVNSIERRTGQIFLALALLCGGILLSGAKAVTDDLRHRPEHLQQVDTALQDWSRLLTQGTVFHGSDLTPADALLIVKSCSVRVQTTGRILTDGSR